MNDEFYKFGFMRIGLGVFFVFICSLAFGQSYFVNLKVGPSLAFQQWNNSASNTNSQLYAYHAALGIESYSEGSNSSLFAQIGYHIRGSAIRYISSGYIDPTTGHYTYAPGATQTFQFKNLALLLGAKKKNILGSKDAYFTFGIRGEYTLSTNLVAPDPNSFYAYSFYPVSAGVNKLNYGVSLGGGYEIKFSDLVGGAIELNIHRDFSNQYYSPPIPNVYSIDYTTGQRILVTLPEEAIKNTTMELSFVLRLLRKVVYTD